MSKSNDLDFKYFHRDFLYQYIASISGTLSVLVSGMHYGWPSPALPILLSKDSSIPLTSSDGSWVAVMPCIGSPVGAVLAALISGKAGRKTCLLAVSPIFFITWLAIAYAPSLFVLYIARFIAGVLDGVTYLNLPRYIGEVTDRRIRGLLGSCMTLASMLGVLLINILGLYCNIRVAALISMIFPVIHFLIFVCMPESPYYYLEKQKHSLAARSIKKLTRTTDPDRELSRLKQANTFDVSGFKSLLHLLKKKASRKSLGIVVGLIALKHFSGDLTIVFYCYTIFKEAGCAINEITATIIYFSVQIPFAMLSSILVDKTGRRPLLILSTLGAGIAQASLGTYFYLKTETNIDISMLNFFPLIALLFYSSSFNIGLNTIPTLFLSEMFPSHVKVCGLCIAISVFGMSVVTASKFFQVLNDNIGKFVPFFAFSICCAIGLIFIVFCVPETKDKTLEQIQEELEGVNKQGTKNFFALPKKEHQPFLN